MNYVFSIMYYESNTLHGYSGCSININERTGGKQEERDGGRDGGRDKQKGEKEYVSMGFEKYSVVYLGKSVNYQITILKTFHLWNNANVF